MSPERGSLLAGGHFPYSDRLVIAARSQGFAVRAESNRWDKIGMSSEGESFLTACHIPKSEPFLVIVGRGEGLAIWTERHGIEAVAIPLDGAGVLTADHVPEFDRLVVTFPPTGRGEGLTVGT